METLTLKRLHWACRRGMLELDVLLGNFLREAFLTLSPEHQEFFITLLNHPDQDLYLWLTGKARPPSPPLMTIIEKVRHHANHRHTPEAVATI